MTVAVNILSNNFVWLIPGCAENLVAHLCMELSRVRNVCINDPYHLNCQCKQLEIIWNIVLTEVHDVLHHDVGSVLGSHCPSLQARKPALHHYTMQTQILLKTTAASFKPCLRIRRDANIKNQNGFKPTWQIACIDVKLFGENVNSAKKKVNSLRFC
jgi:hypothetical protein